MEKKMFYVPPTVEVMQVVLEGNIAAQSTMGKTSLKEWENDPDANSIDNNADIVLSF